jgi:mono/diheme cytochrome c family protein
MPGAGAALDGRALFQAKGCATCHTGPDTVAMFQAGFPNLRDTSTWTGRGRPGQSTAEYIAQSIVEPWAVMAPGFSSALGPTGAMPKLDVSDAEVEALVAYLVDP